MLILSRVCADFYDRKGARIHRIRREDLGLFRDVPEGIREDPLFQMLVNDGSIKFPQDAKTDKALEDHPYAGATPDGKEIKPTVMPAEEQEEMKPKTTARAKTESSYGKMP